MNKKATYEKEILKVIKENNLFVIKDIFAFYSGVKSSQFYNLELEKSESIKKAIDDNKIKTCQSLKNKWYKSEVPTLQIALFKTICDDNERQKLSQAYVDIKSSDGSMSPNKEVDLSGLSDKDLDIYEKLQEKIEHKK